MKFFHPYTEVYLKKKSHKLTSYPHLISFGYTTSVNLRTDILINSRVQKQINSQYLFLMAWIVQFSDLFFINGRPMNVLISLLPLL